MTGRTLARSRARRPSACRIVAHRCAATASRSRRRSASRLTARASAIEAGERESRGRRVNSAPDRSSRRASVLPVIEGRLRKAFHDAVLRRRARFAAVAQLFGAVNYRGVLARGFALVRDERDAPIKRAAKISPPQSIKIQFADGEVAATAGAPPSARRARRKTADDDQSRLF